MKKLFFTILLLLTFSTAHADETLTNLDTYLPFDKIEQKGTGVLLHFADTGGKWLMVFDKDTKQNRVANYGETFELKAGETLGLAEKHQGMKVKVQGEGDAMVLKVDYTSQMKGQMEKRNYTIALGSNPNPANTYRLTIAQYVDTFGQNPQYVYIIGENAYRSLEDLKKFVVNLPTGATLEWRPSHRSPVPLSQPEEASLKAVCDSKGIKFVHVPSG